MHRVILIDGSVAMPPVLLMKRSVGGRIEFRLPTADEVADYISDDAW